MNVFRIRDLTLKKIPLEFAKGSFGTTWYPDPDSDPDDFPPTITPVIMIDKYAERLEVLDKIPVEKLDLAMIDQIALDVGRAVVASKFFQGTALCAQDAPTCAANPTISPIASLADDVTNVDVGLARERLTTRLEQLNRFTDRF
jgi:hypothetical protein